MTTVDRALKLEIWQTLDALARRHRAYSGSAKWALPPQELDRLDAIVAKLTPDDPVDHYSWLFVSALPDLKIKRSPEFTVYEAAVAEERSKALQAIANEKGMAGIHRLLTVSNQHFAIGYAAAADDVGLSDDEVLEEVDSDDRSRSEFATGFVWRRIQLRGWDWMNNVLSRLTDRPRAQARVLRGVREDFRRVWRRAEELGPEISEAYWEELQPYGLGSDFALIPEVAEQLVQHHRPFTAVDFLSMYLNNEGTGISSELVARALEALLDDAEGEQRQAPSYDISNLLDYLRSSDIDQDRLAVLEWSLLPGLGHGARSPVLEKRLARSPTFFVDVLSLCFKRRDGQTDREVRTEVAENAFRLLRDWQIVPGSQDRGADVDESTLREWLSETRRLLGEADRSEVGDIYIGHVFAHAKTDADSSWPTVPVRSAIEELASDQIDQGFGTEIYNKRGITTRALEEGGQQEYALAEELDRLAEQIGAGWPRTAAVLRLVSENYKAEGRVHDEEAQRFIEGLD